MWDEDNFEFKSHILMENTYNVVKGYKLEIKKRVKPVRFPLI